MSSRYIGELVKAVVGIRPAAAVAAGVINSPAIDRAGAQSCEVLVATGAETGAPTARAVATKVQDSADGATGWADIPGATTPDVTAVNSEQATALNLTASTKPWIRLVHTVSFTGGTTPAIFVGSTVVLGGYRSLPK